MACPRAETLVAYALGELSTRAAEIGAHVETCMPCVTFVGEVVEGVLAFPDLEPTPDERAALDQDGQACWQDFLDRHGAALGIGGGSTPPNEETCADLVRDLTELGATNWRSFLTRYEDALWPTGEDDANE